VHKGKISNGEGGAILSNAYGVVLQGDYAYVASQSGGTFDIINVSDPANPVHEGYYSDGTSGSSYLGSHPIVVSGPYVYLASASGNAIDIVDISDSTNPVVKGRYTNSTYVSNPRSIALSGNYIYTVGGSNRLSVINVSDPANPVLAGSIAAGTNGALLNSPRSVFVSGSYAYVVSRSSSSFEIFDISRPSNPVLKSSIINGSDGASLSGAYSVFVSNNYAYVASVNGNTLEILDISNPSNPVHSGTLSIGNSTVGNPTTVIVSGNYAYVTTNGTEGTFNIVDVSDPTSPTIKSTVTHGENGASLSGAWSVGVNGNYAYIANNASGDLEIIDISGLIVSNAEIGNLKVGNFAVSSSAKFNADLSIRSSLNVGQNALIGGTLSVTGLSGTTTSSSVVNISALFAGGVGIGTSTPYSRLSVWGSDTATSTRLFELANSASTTLMSVQNNGTGYFVGNLGLGTTSPYAKLSVVGEVVAPYYTATSTTATSTFSGGLSVAGSSGFTILQNGKVGMGTLTPTEKLTVQGTILTAPPTTLTIKGSVTDTTNLGGSYGSVMAPNNKVFVSGNYAYVVANTNSRLTIVDISNPSSPMVVGSISDAVNLNGPQSVYVAGRYAYVVSSVGDSITVVDISNPVTPTVVAMLSDSTYLNGAKGIDIQGNYAYITAYDAGRLTVVDISNPYSPTVAGSLGSLTTATSVVVSGRYAYLTSSDVNFRIIDISNPSSPTASGVTNSIQASHYLYGVAISGRYAYLTTIRASQEADSFAIVDIKSPTAPSATSSSLVAGGYRYPLGVTVSGHYAYVTYRGGDYLRIYDISVPTAPVLAGSITSSSLNMASAIAVSGRYAYALSPDDGRLTVVDIGGSDIDSLNVGSLSSGNIQANDSLIVNNNANIRGGMQVGPGGIYSQGAIGIKGSGSGTGTSFRIQNSIGSSTLSFLDNGKLGLSTTTPSSRLSITQSANTAYGGIWLAETGNTDFRSQFMDTSGILSFYGGDTAGTLNTATLNAAGEWTNASDIAYKTNIRNMEEKYGLATILLTTPRLYEMKGTASSTRICIRYRWLQGYILRQPSRCRFSGHQGFECEGGRTRYKRYR